METSAVLSLTGIALAIFIPVVVVFWRNLTLLLPWKAIFCFSILPVFLAAMIFSIWLTDTYAPWLFEMFALAEKSGNRFMETNIGFLIAVPIALVVSMLWYFLLLAADLATRRASLIAIRRDANAELKRLMTLAALEPQKNSSAIQPAEVFSSCVEATRKAQCYLSRMEMTQRVLSTNAADDGKWEGVWVWELAFVYPNRFHVIQEVGIFSEAQSS